MAQTKAHVPHLGLDVVLVDREQLRHTRHGRTLRVPQHLKALSGTLPTPPAVFDWSRAGQTRYPMLGNDRVGDCYMTAAAHHVQTWAALNGPGAEFNESALVTRYLQLSGGDNGLSDAQIYPEWEGGIIGPNGPHKLLDEMTVDPRDDASTAFALWLCCGLLYTAALPDAWIQSARPGATWGAGRPNPRNGHATHLSGKNTKGGYDLQTWGFGAPVNLTPAGLKSADPELIACASLEMFGPTGLAPNGLSYAQFAGYWTAVGGKPLPPSPFPVPPPVPPPPSVTTFVLYKTLEPGTYSVTKQ